MVERTGVASGKVVQSTMAGRVGRRMYAAAIAALAGLGVMGRILLGDFLAEASSPGPREDLWDPTLRVTDLGKCREGCSGVVVMKSVGEGQTASALFCRLSRTCLGMAYAPISPPGLLLEWRIL